MFFVTVLSDEKQYSVTKDISIILFINLLVSICFQCNGMLKPDQNANIDDDVKKINDAFGHWNTNEDVFLEILPYRGCKQRSEIYQKLDQVFILINIFVRYSPLTLASPFLLPPKMRSGNQL